MPNDDPAQGHGLRLLEYTAPVLLSVLALTQIYLGNWQSLTPWKGGGFGMFSTVDSPSSRTVRVYLKTPDGEIPTQLPDWLKLRGEYAESLPAGFRLRSLAAKLATLDWVYPRPSDAADAAPPPHPAVEVLRPGKKPGDRRRVGLRGVRVEIWTTRFDFDSDTLTLEKLADATAEAPPA